MNDKLVSVLMPAYNAEKFIQQAIESILAQTHRNLELLIINDNSTDRTGDIINNYKDPRIRIFNNEINEGYLKSTNTLFKNCYGDFVTFQDSDDWSEPVRLEMQLAFLLKDDSLSALGTSCYIVNTDGEITGEDIKEDRTEVIESLIDARNQFVGSTIMVKRDVLTKVGGFRDFFNNYGNEDYDWAFRIVERFKTSNIKIPLYYYRQHAGGISKAFTVERNIGAEVVRFLANQRKEFKTDDLMTNGDDLNNFLQTLKAPYAKDTSLLYRQIAARMMFCGLKKRAIESSWIAVTKKPLSIENWRTFQYCIRKSLLKI